MSLRSLVTLYSFILSELYMIETSLKILCIQQNPTILDVKYLFILLSLNICVLLFLNICYNYPKYRSFDTCMPPPPQLF